MLLKGVLRMSPDVYARSVRGRYPNEIRLTGVECTGFETSLSQCRAVGYSYCIDIHVAAGVTCLDGV